MGIKKIRLIPRLDVKAPNIVKGISLEGLRVVGNPTELAREYYRQGADELLYIDIVASLYERNSLIDIIKKTVSRDVFIPVTVGGGIRSIDDIRLILRAGADKVAINTAATKNPNIITEASRIFGSQCVVGSIEAKYNGQSWEAYIDNGRERTGLEVVAWAKKLVELGAGELLITSVDRDGTKKGFDYELIKKIVSEVNVPVIACGGAGSKQDIKKCFTETHCDAVAFGSILHYRMTTVSDVNSYLSDAGFFVRKNLDLDIKPETSKTVSIIDYGVGNLMSVISAFEYLGNPVKVVESPEEIMDAELLILPGDGAFHYGMEQLKKRNLLKAINHYISSGKPFLGICLGMQLLMSKSSEFEETQGLNLIEGVVIPFYEPKSELPDYRVPHMGWNNLVKPDNIDWENTMLKSVSDDSEVYFVHSFKVMPKNKAVIVATTNYGGQEFCSVVQKNNLYGVQFHPEKSGAAGMRMLFNFSRL